MFFFLSCLRLSPFCFCFLSIGAVCVCVCVCVCWSIGFSIYLNCLFFQHVVSNFFPQFFLPVLSDGRIRTHDLTISCRMLQQLCYRCWPYHFLSVKLSLSDSCSCYQNNPLFLLLLYLVKDYGIFGGKKCQGNFEVSCLPWFLGQWNCTTRMLILTLLIMTSRITWHYIYAFIYCYK